MTLHIVASSGIPHDSNEGTIGDDAKALLQLAEKALGPPKNIFEAAERGLVGWIVKAVERSIDYNINQRDRLQRTAMHWASENGHVEVVEALMDYGCNVRLTECNGRTAFHLAARGLHIPVMKTLLEGMTEHEMECMVNSVDNFGITPVSMALQKGDDGSLCFQFLMDRGARYNTASMPKYNQEELNQVNPVNVADT